MLGPHRSAVERLHLEDGVVPQRRGGLVRRVEDLVLRGKGVVRGVGAAHDLPAPRQPVRLVDGCLVAVEVADEDLAGGGLIDGGAAPRLQQRYARLLDDLRVAAEAIVLLQDAPGQG